MRRQYWLCLLAGVGLRAALVAQPVVLVRGTNSVPPGPEQRAADNVTRLLSRWLTDLGVPYRLIDDVHLGTETGGPPAAIILSYTPQLRSPHLRAIRTCVDRGAKVLVFYGQSPELAGWMDLRLGPYTNTLDPGRWAAMRFLPGVLPGGPAVVRQSSRSLRPVYPASPRSRTIAFWENADGRVTELPAWVQTPLGYWMSHILVDDGDTWNKQQMLLALLGTLMPDLWTRSAQHLSSHLLRTPDGEPWVPLEPENAKGLARMKAMLAEGKTLHAVAEMGALRHARTRSWLTRQPLPLPPLRGVWARADQIPITTWTSLCTRLSQHGITDLFFHGLSPDAAHYPSTVLPPSEWATAFGDMLRVALEAAHAAGLRFHVWKVCWRLESKATDRRAELQRAGRLQVSDRGETLDWLCPSHPDNLRAEKDAIRELVRRYPVDGIHLDYIRYPDARACFCAGCRSRFESRYQQRLPRWPLRPSDGPLWEEYSRWRVQQITRLVTDIRAMLKKERPAATFSAAVFGRYPSCVASVGQDWAAWLREGLVDFVCPMNYTPDATRFRQWVRDQMGLVDVRERIFPGIGVTASESRLDTIDAIEQMRIVCEEGGRGWVLFFLNRVLLEEVLPYMQASKAGDSSRAGR